MKALSHSRSFILCSSDRIGRDIRNDGRKIAAPATAAPAIPKWIGPQLSRLVSQAPDGAEWLHDIKFDGYQMHARVEGGRARLLDATRSRLDQQVCRHRRRGDGSPSGFGLYRWRVVGR